MSKRTLAIVFSSVGLVLLLSGAYLLIDSLQAPVTPTTPTTPVTPDNNFTSGDFSRDNCRINNVEECDDNGRSYCGLGCNSDADCIPRGSNGSPTKCVEGRCEAANCPAGGTLKGRNCDCNARTASCGQPCGNGYPLCASGSTCRYIVGPSCTSQNISENRLTTYCVPNGATGYDAESCVDRDTGNRYLTGPNGKVTFTAAEIQQICNPSQCSDGEDNDGDGKVDCDPGNEDPGCFPDGRGGGGACNPNDNSERDSIPVLPRTAIADDITSIALVVLAILMIAAGASLYKKHTGK